jgi:hypothetical protein
MEYGSCEEENKLTLENHQGPCAQSLVFVSVCPCRFSLGDTPPQINGIKVYRQDGGTDEILSEVDFMWAGQQNISLVCCSASPTTHRLLLSHAPGK